MQRYQLLSFFIVMIFLQQQVAAQNNQAIQNYNGAKVSKNIAQTLQDSLNLTGTQKKQLESINMELHTQKMNARSQYAGQDSLLRRKIQLIENTRDSLYRPILGETKYLLYRQNKYKLLRAN